MSKDQKQLKLHAVCDGEIIAIEDVDDIIFSEKMIGDGYALLPTDGNIYSPVSGEITEVAATKHAFYIALEDDNKILIHIGEDTLLLKGEGFSVDVEKGDKIKAGDHLGSVDLDYLMDQDYDVAVSVIFLFNSKIDLDVQSYPQKNAKAKETLACDIIYKAKDVSDS